MNHRPVCAAERALPILASVTLLVASLVSSPALRAQEEIIAPNEFWRFFRGTEEPPADWNTVGFDDSAWEEGEAGFGYGDGDDVTILADMRQQGAEPGYLSVYIRKTFEVDDPDGFKLLELGMQWDDGFVAYLNGTEIERQNMGLPGTPAAFNQTASSHENDMQTMWFQVSEDLQQGTNVLAIQGHNTNLTSSDFSLIPELRGFTDLIPLCPQDLTCSVRNETDVRLIWRLPVRPAPYDEVQVVRNGEMIAMVSSPTLRTSHIDRDVPSGEHTYEIVAIIGGEPCSEAGVPSCTVTVIGPGVPFRRGDADDNGAANLTDAVVILQSIFLATVTLSCPDAGDVDDTGSINITDAIFLLQALFAGGDPPPPPGRFDCGIDGTDTDPLTDCTYTSCE